MTNISSIDKDRFYTVAETAPFVNLDGRSVRRLANNGKFPGTQRKSPVPGSPLLIPGSGIIAFLEARKIK